MLNKQMKPPDKEDTINKSILLNWLYSADKEIPVSELRRWIESRTNDKYTLIKKEIEDITLLNTKSLKKILNIKEKPKKTNSNLAITGLYFFDKNVVSFSKKLKPSKRKELEIVDLLKAYLKKRKLKIEPMGRGSAWLDTGNVDSLFETSQFIANIEKRQGLKIACLEEIALSYKWILKSTIKKQIKFYGNCCYSDYLKKLL